MNILLVNPPIYDFTAFDFWLRPYGLLRVGGRLRAHNLAVFDYLVSHDRAAFGRGRFDRQSIKKPAPLADIPRRFYRFGRARGEFLKLLSTRTFDVVLVQTVMTYWYPGVREVIEDVRKLQPRAKIILGGVYATLCPDHARSLGADQVLEGSDLESLRLELRDEVPLWEGVDARVGVLQITGIALMLVAIGLYGIVSYSVARRSNEMGIRLALGAPPSSLIWLVEREILVLTGIGALVGIGASRVTPSS